MTFVREKKKGKKEKKEEKKATINNIIVLHIAKLSFKRCLKIHLKVRIVDERERKRSISIQDLSIKKIYLLFCYSQFQQKKKENYIFFT